MLFGEVARKVKRIVRFVFNGVDMSGGMLFDVLDDLPGIPFEMIGVFDECVASAGEGVLGHIHNCDRTPGNQLFQWGLHPTSNHQGENYSYDYESTRYFNRLDALVRWRRILPRRTAGRWRWVWTHLAGPAGSLFYRSPWQQITRHAQVKRGTSMAAPEGKGIDQGHACLDRRRSLKRTDQTAWPRSL